MSATPAYDALKLHRLRIYNLEHLQAIASWDRYTNMPSGGARARAAAQGELAALLQRMASEPELETLLAVAEEEALDQVAATDLSLMMHERRRAKAVPDALARRRSELAGASLQAWGEAKADNDWSRFAPLLAPLVDCIAEIGDRIGDALGISRYDALLDGFDRGLRADRVRALFGDVAGWLPAMIRQATERQAGEPVIDLVGPFDPARQRALCADVMAMLGFDFAKGRLDTSAHPFTGGTPEDVRLTTRYRDDEILPALLGIVHETGHGRYQAGLPRDRLGQLVGEPCSAAMHEAQALSFERQIAPTRAFVEKLSPMLAQAFGDQPGFAPDNLRRLMTRVRPGMIRVEADELTYAAHVMLRVDIEAELFEGAIGVEDIPARWDAAMQALLGVDTRGDFARGPLQDIHWAQGMFGYFPAYLLGAMAAAQLVDAFRRTRPDQDPMREPRDLDGLPDWLAEHVWSKGAIGTTEQLIAEASGGALSADALQAHLTRRYLP